MRQLLLLLLFLLVLVSPASAVLYVGYSGNSGDYNTDGTNDEVQINQAIAAARSTGDHTVYLNGPHTYTIDAPILIYDNIKLTGNSGAIVKLAVNAEWGAGVPMMRGYTSSPFSTSGTAGSGYGDNFEMYGFIIDGTSGSQSDMTSLGAGFYSVMQLHGVDNVKVHHMTMRYGGSDGLCTRSSTNIHFYNNDILDLGHDAYYNLYSSNVGTMHDNTVKTRSNSAARISQGSNGLIYNNYIYSEHASSRSGPGVEIDCTNPASTYAMQNNQVYNNIFDTIYGSGIFMLAEYSDNSKRATNQQIHHNIFKNCGKYPSASYSDAGIFIHQHDQTKIYNNVFDNCGVASVKWQRFYKDSDTNDIVMGSSFTQYVYNNLIMDTEGKTGSTTGYGILNTGEDASHNTFVVQYNDLYNNDVAYSGTQIQYSNNLAVAPQVYEGVGQGMRYAPYSKYGRSTGAVWVYDSVQSPLIDAGLPYSTSNAISSYANEPEDNGNRVNIGRWGNTAYASKSGGGGSTVEPPSLFSAVNLNVTYGQKAYLAWLVKGSVTSVYLQPNNVYLIPVASGNYEWTVTETKTYTLTATGPGGTDTDVFTINCLGGAPDITAFNANPGTVVSGGSSTLSWAISGTVTSLSIDNGVGPVSPFAAGSKVVNPTSTTTYKITATGPGGTDTATRTVTVTAAPIYPTIDTFTSNTTTSYSGDDVFLSWTTTNAASATLNNGIGSVAVDGTRIVAPTENTSYMLSATNANGTVYAYKNITVLPIPVYVPPVNVLDTRIKSGSPTTNYKNLEYIDVGAFDPVTSSKYRGLLWMNTSMYAPGTIIDDAKLNLFWYYASTSRTQPTILELYRPVGWNIDTVTWNNKNAGSWSNPGGDWYDKNNVLQGSNAWTSVTIPVGSPTNSYIQLDVTDLVQGYVNGSPLNAGFLLKTKNESYDYVAFRSNDYVTNKPYLSVSVGPVNITNPSPTNSEFGLMVNSSQDFSVGLSKTGDVDWYLNGTLVRADDMVAGPSEYSMDFDASGNYTVEARTCTDSRVWEIEVIGEEPDNPPIPYIPDGNAWVAWSGNDSTGNGSIVNPYATVGKALELPFNGSLIINVMGGDYTENVVVTHDNITITSYSGIASFNGSGTGFNVTDKSNFSIEDICIGGYEVGILSENVTGLSLDGVSIEDGSQSLVINGSSNVTILDGSFNSSDGMDIGSSENITISDNTFLGDIGVVLYEDTNVTITNNNFQSTQSSIRMGSVYGFESSANILDGQYGYEFESSNQYEPVYLNLSGDASFEYLYLFNKDSSEDRNVTRTVLHNGSDVDFKMYTGFNGSWSWIRHGAVLKQETTKTPSYSMDNVQEGDGILSLCSDGNDTYQIWWQREGEYVEPPFENEGANITSFSPLFLQFNVTAGTRQYFSVMLDSADDVKWTVNNNLLRYRENVTGDEFRYRADDLGWYNVTVTTTKSIYTWQVQVVR